MALAATFDFNPDIAEMAEEAFELCGLEIRSGNDLRTVRRSLNYLSLEWQNKGLNLWTIEEKEITAATIVAGTHTYDIDVDTISILDAVLRTNDADTSLQSDIVITRISQTTYAQLPNKLTSGRPYQYWFNRIGVKDDTSSTDRPPTITFWPVPDESSKYTFVYWRMRRMSDVGISAANTMDLPDRFLPAMRMGLAYYIAMKKAPGRMSMLKEQYMELFEDAIGEDREKADFTIKPDLTAYRNGR